MSHRWPSETVFREVNLFLHGQACEFCEGNLHVCGHRKRRVFTWEGPWLLKVRVGHCADPGCPGHRGTVSPRGEMAIAPPYLQVAWDTFAWIGHRRFARHWSVPQICAELRDSRAMRISEDAIEEYVVRYEAMVAARHGDLKQLRKVYAKTKSLFLAIDGLQPEKGHETLYVVRELNRKRVWFAEPLLSSTTDEVRQLLIRAREIAKALGKPVAGWISDKQDAFVQGIADEFPDAPHHYCENHFLRDLAKPVLEQDSHAKVHMRRKVRGLRAIEREVLRERAETAVSPGQLPTAPPRPPRAEKTAVAVPRPVPKAPPQGPVATSLAVVGQPQGEPSPGSQVVLDYCACVRGILNDDQGGPLHPPGLRMTNALQDVRQSLQRNLRVKKGGLRKGSCGV